MESTALAAQPRTRPDRRAWVLLVFGVVTASFSAIFVRYATGAEALAISFWRCAAGAAILAPFAARKLRAMDARTFRVCIVSGAFLAFHFATWISSLELTSVASSVLLVSTTPVFVAVAEKWFFGERLPTAGWMGIALALAGTALVLAGTANAGGADSGEGSLTGDFLAVCGAIGAAGYVLAGRDARRTVGVIEYSVVTYGSAALFLLVACVVGSVPLAGWGTQTWWALAAIIVGPQLLGHTVINEVLSDIDATTISVTIMAEPIIATAAAFVLFSETPSWTTYPGGAAILAGIYVVSSAGRTPVVISE